jgi:hypothetical protein
MNMQTVEETRRIRLGMLATKMGSAANLAHKLSRAEAQISQYVTQKRNIGSDFARYVETTLELEVGWMDTPPTYAEMHGDTDPISKAMMVMEAMDDSQRYQALRLLDALTQPAPPLKTGTDS